MYARGGNRLHSVQPCLSPRARHGRLLDGFLPLRRRAHASALPLTKCSCEREGPKLRERCRVKRTKIAKTQRRVAYRGRFPHYFTPSRAVGVAALPCPGEQGACRDQQRSPFRITDASRSGFVGEMMIYPLIHALAGCGRRCAVLIFEEIGPSSTQHRVGVASFRSEQQYLYGIATIFRFRAQVMSQLWAVLRFSYLGPPRSRV